MTSAHWYIHVCMCVFLKTQSSYINNAPSWPSSISSMLKSYWRISYYVCGIGFIMIYSIGKVLFASELRLSNFVYFQVQSRFCFITCSVFVNNVNNISCRGNIMSKNRTKALGRSRKASWRKDEHVKFVYASVYIFKICISLWTNVSHSIFSSNNIHHTRWT